MAEIIIGTIIGVIISIAVLIYIGYWVWTWLWDVLPPCCSIGCIVYVAVVLIGALVSALIPKSTADISGLKVGYLTEEAYNNGAFDESAITDEAEFAVGTPQYAVIDFTVKTTKKNDGDKWIKLYTALSDGNAVSMAIQDAPTGRVEIGESDSSHIYTYYTIPSKKKDEKTVRMILKLVPNTSGEVDLNIALWSYFTDGDNSRGNNKFSMAQGLRYW